VEKIVVALIGAGGISRSQHLPNLSRAPHIDFQWVCDLDREKLDYAQKHYHVPKATTNIDEILADRKVGMVLVATREDMQAPLTIQALQAGKHVYVEKPLATSPDMCEQVVEAQEKSGKNVAVGFNRRLSPAYRKAKEIMDARGGASNIFYRISDNYWQWSQRFGYEPGTRVVHEVCHIFDIIRFFTGSDVAGVYCVESRSDDEIITLKMRNNAVATIMDSGYTHTDMPKEHLEVILGDKGGLIVDDFIELKQYGSLKFEPRYTFAGHTHTQCEYTHKYLYEELGLQAHEAMRRVLWKKRLQWENGEFGEETPGLEELKRFLIGRKDEMATNANYISNKGWLDAVEHFAQCCLSGAVPSTATAGDGAAASLIAQAAIESRGSGKPVLLR
jgi:predicted dehydrogenase